MYFCILDEGVESGTETESGRSPRLMLNLQRQFISPSFAKFLNEELVCDRLDDILTESDFRERIVPGEDFLGHFNNFHGKYHFSPVEFLHN